MLKILIILSSSLWEIRVKVGQALGTVDWHRTGAIDVLLVIVITETGHLNHAPDRINLNV